MIKPLDYIVTFSGREVSLTHGVPSVEDLALSLSRQPRFGGMCRRHWTVVDHSLFTAILAEREGEPVEVQLACLLHDAHEWTGDIPTHFKTGAQRGVQQDMDRSIFATYFPGGLTNFVGTGNEIAKAVKKYDRRALLAEALVVGPPSFKFSSDILEHFGDRPILRDVIALVVRLRTGELGVDPSELSFYNQAKNAQAFIKKLRSYRYQLTGTTASRHSEPKGFVANESKESI